MPLTPADVHNVVFSRPRIGKRGYSEHEVDRLLEMVESELLRHIAEKNELRKLNAELLKRDAAIQKRDAELREWDAKLRQLEAELRECGARRRDHEAGVGERPEAPQPTPADILEPEPLRQAQIPPSGHNGTLPHTDDVQQSDGTPPDDTTQETGTGPNLDTPLQSSSEEVIVLAPHDAQVIHMQVAPHLPTEPQRAAVSQEPIASPRTATGAGVKRDPELGSFRTVAELLGNAVTESTQQQWTRKTRTTQEGSDVASMESAQLRQLQRENAELNRINSILKATAALFATQIQRP